MSRPTRRQPPWPAARTGRSIWKRRSRPNSAAARGAERPMVNGRPAVHRLTILACAPDGAASGPGGALTVDQLPFAARERELTRRIHAYDPRADTALVDAAYAMAADAHRHQQRENGDPYITHPLAVARS